MANCCFVDMCYVFKEEDKAKEFFSKLEANRAKAKEEGVDGVYIGSSRRYMFDGSYGLNGAEVTIDGWVKWSLSDYEFLQALRYAGIENLDSLSVQEEERSCCIYGYTTWDGGETLHSRYVESGSWPECPPDDASEEEKEDWYDNGEQEALDALLAEATVEDITFKKVEEDEEKRKELFKGLEAM